MCSGALFVRFTLSKCLREHLTGEKSISFGHCPNYLYSPPPIRASCTTFVGRQKPRFSTYYKTKYNDDYDNDGSDNCDYDFDTFDNFGVKYDLKVSQYDIDVKIYGTVTWWKRAKRFG